MGIRTEQYCTRPSVLDAWRSPPEHNATLLVRSAVSRTDSTPAFLSRLCVICLIVILFLQLRAQLACKRELAVYLE